MRILLMSLILMASFVVPQMVPGANAQEPKSVELKTPPDLPFLPPYSGKTRNMLALDYPHLKKGRQVTLTFDCAETREDVKNFYRSAFKQYGWQVNKEVKAERHLAANRGTTTCTISFLEMPVQRKKTEFITTVFVNYRSR